MVSMPWPLVCQPQLLDDRPRIFERTDRRGIQHCVAPSRGVAVGGPTAANISPCKLLLFSLFVFLSEAYSVQKQGYVLQSLPAGEVPAAGGAEEVMGWVGGWMGGFICPPCLFTAIMVVFLITTITIITFIIRHLRLIMETRGQEIKVPRDNTSIYIDQYTDRGSEGLGSCVGEEITPECQITSRTPRFS